MHLEPSLAWNRRRYPLLATSGGSLLSVDPLPPLPAPFVVLGRLPEAGSGSSSSNKIEKKQTRSVNPVNSEKIPLNYHWIVALNYLILAWSVPEISRRLIVACLAVFAHSSQAFHRFPS